MTDSKGNPVKVIALALLLKSGSALAVQPITTLPLTVDAVQRWHLPARAWDRSGSSLDRRRRRTPLSPKSRINRSSV